MPPIYTCTRVLSVVSQLVTGVGAELAASSPGGEVNRLVTTYGSVVADECQCGQFAISVNRVFPTDELPIDQSNSPVRCDLALLSANMTASIMRCVPAGDDNGNPPTPTELQEALEIALCDAYIVRETIRCMLDVMYQTPEYISDYVIGAQTMTEPQGGCAGSELDFTVGFIMPCLCG